MISGFESLTEALFKMYTRNKPVDGVDVSSCIERFLCELASTADPLTEGGGDFFIQILRTLLTPTELLEMLPAQLRSHRLVKPQIAAGECREWEKKCGFSTLETIEEDDIEFEDESQILQTLFPNYDDI